MRGAVAAGHPLTAEVGAEILREGGNAVDACVAASVASWVAESPLAGPGGGGFMLIHGCDGSNRLLDFFTAIPGLGRPRGGPPQMEVVDIAFEGGESSQVFRIGPGSAATPGSVAGLEAAHRAHGSLPWQRLFEPAIRLARDGIEVTRAQAYLHAILDLILRHSSEGRAIYSVDGRRAVAGDLLRLEDLAVTLERLAARGAAELYQGTIARRIVQFVQAGGGDLTEADLRAYRVIRRRPIRVSFLGHDVVSNPPPSSGGVLIGYGLRLLDRLGVGGPPGSTAAVARLIEVMREQQRARAGRFATELHRGGLAQRLFAAETVDEAVQRVEERTPGAAELAPLGGTTHISVVDGDGNAASLSASLGSGSGAIVPGTGIHLNNTLGEYDLAPAGGRGTAGKRLTSMMAPSIVLAGERPRLVVGSAGSVRLRGAIMQAIVNVVGHGLSVEDAIDRPRVHVDGPHVHCEGGHDASELDRLEAAGYDVVRWRRRNLYFGGAAGVEFRADGSVAAGGDPRRGGAGVVAVA